MSLSSHVFEFVPDESRGHGNGVEGLHHQNAWAPHVYVSREAVGAPSMEMLQPRLEGTLGSPIRWGTCLIKKQFH